MSIFSMQDLFKVRHTEDDNGLVVGSSHGHRDIDDEDDERQDNGNRAVQKAEDKKKVAEKKKQDQGRSKRLEPSFKWRVLNVHDAQE